MTAPLKTVFTERLVIRPLTIDDYDMWIYGFKSRRPKQNTFDSDTPDLTYWDRAFFQRNVEQFDALADEDDAYIFGIFISETGEHIGKLEFTILQRTGFDWAMFGYLIHNQYWNNGYGNEVLTAVDEIGKQLELHRIEAHVNPNHDISMKLIERNGFEYEGVRKSFIHENEQWNDYRVYVKVIN